jgi:chromosome segregation ATPase
MDPMPISAYKMGRILRKDEKWVESLQDIMTPEEKTHLQELLRGTQNQYGGTMAPSATKIYEFEESIYERKIQKDKKDKEAQYEKLTSNCENILNEFSKMSSEYDKLEKQIKHNTRHIEQLTSNAAQLTNQVEQLMEMVSQLIQIEYDKKNENIE